jgi:iron complex outermembrane receptor protein
MNVLKNKSIFLQCLLVVFVICSSTLSAQNVLRGVVKNQNEEPLEGATIKLIDSETFTATNANGEFSVSVSQTNLTIQVSFVGYQTLTQDVSVNQTISITLKEGISNLDEVFVSAVRATKLQPFTFSNVSKEDIANRNLGQDMPVLLSYLPSVVSSSDAGAGIGYNYLRVRGSDDTRINVTINGIPYNDPESQGTFWVNLGDFASSVENLQLQRGVGTSTNGSGAFGASLNILTDNISEDAGGEIANSFGSFGTRKHTLKYTTGLLNEHFEFSGRVSNIYSDGYVDRASTDLKSYYFQGNYKDDNRLIKAITFGGTERTYQSWFGLTEEELKEDRRQNPYTYDNQVDNYQQDHYQLHWNERYNNNWSTNIGLNYTKGSGYFEQFREEENADDFANLIEDGSDVIVRRWLDNDFYVANANITYRSSNVEVISGVSYSDYTNDHFGEVIWGSDLAANTEIRDRYYFSDSKKNDFSSFIKSTFKVAPKLSAYVDLQGRFVSYKTQGLSSDRTDLDVDSDFSFFNPKAGLTYELNTKNIFYASYARANREPNRNDFEGGTTQYETLDDFELGYRLNTDKVQLNANLFFMNYKNQLVLSGAINDVGELERTTSGNSYRLGIELDATVKLSKHFTIQPNVALSDNRNKDFTASIDGNLENLGNTPISFSPDIIVGNLFTYTNKGFSATLLSKFVGEQYMGNLGGRISDNELLDDYFTSDLNIAYKLNLKKVFKSITFQGLVNNIFNREYVNRGYYFFFDDDFSNPNVVTTVDGAGFYPQATINFLLGATIKF